MKAINEHFEVGQQYYALVSKEVLVVSEVLQPGMYPSGSGGYHTLRSPMVRFRSEKTGLVHTCSLELAKHLLLAKRDKSDCAADYPGVFIDFVREDGATVVLACVEYDPDKDLLQTVVYGDCASDEPTAIVEHYNTDFEE